VTALLATGWRVPGHQEATIMKTTKVGGTRGYSLRGRLPRRGGWGQTWLTAGALTAALLGLTLLAAGCSSGPAASGAAASTVADPLVRQGDADLVNFARCMRAHGVQMSDPDNQPDHVGLTADPPPHSSATRTAYAACDHYLQDLIRIKEARTTALATSRLAALAQYAECMRAHDITMLDPNARGELDLGDVPGMANNDFGRQSPQFHSADAACRHLLPAGTGDDGTGP
jgi:hypothetical protein